MAPMQAFEVLRELQAQATEATQATGATETAKAVEATHWVRHASGQAQKHRAGWIEDLTPALLGSHSRNQRRPCFKRAAAHRPGLLLESNIRQAWVSAARRQRRRPTMAQRALEPTKDCVMNPVVRCLPTPASARANASMSWVRQRCSRCWSA